MSIENENDNTNTNTEVNSDETKDQTVDQASGDSQSNVNTDVNTNEKDQKDSKDSKEVVDDAFETQWQRIEPEDEDQKESVSFINDAADLCLSFKIAPELVMDDLIKNNGKLSKATISLIEKKTGNQNVANIVKKQVEDAHAKFEHMKAETEKRVQEESNKQFESFGGKEKAQKVLDFASKTIEPKMINDLNEMLRYPSDSFIFKTAQQYILDNFNKGNIDSINTSAQKLPEDGIDVNIDDKELLRLRNSAKAEDRLLAHKISQRKKYGI